PKQELAPLITLLPWPLGKFAKMIKSGIENAGAGGSIIGDLDKALEGGALSSLSATGSMDAKLDHATKSMDVLQVIDHALEKAELSPLAKEDAPDPGAGGGEEQGGGGGEGGENSPEPVSPAGENSGANSGDSGDQHMPTGNGMENVQEQPNNAANYPQHGEAGPPPPQQEGGQGQGAGQESSGAQPQQTPQRQMTEEQKNQQNMQKKQQGGGGLGI
ncbi:MAG: hypothetical protein OEY79_04845, partial [Anaplasmataceae bacterium]|nr:hypothetical protein [Anaplasmataceae bacterium]